MSTSVEDVGRLDTELVAAWKRALIACTIALCFTIGIFWSTYVDIVKIWWRSETFAHGFIILPISGFLIWRKRRVLQELTPRPSHLALVFVLGAGLFWLLATVADIAEAQQLAAVALIPILIWGCLGSEVALTIAFPLAYMMFAAPFGDFLTQPLQDVTARLSVWALQITGIPVYLEGRFISIPSGNFEVAQACSGIRYLIASLALGTLYAYLTYINYWRRAIFIAFSMIVPIIANGIRAYGIIILADLSSYRLAVGLDHIIYGWLFFGLVIFLLFWVGSFFRDGPTDSTVQEASYATRQPLLRTGIQQFTGVVITAILISVTFSVYANWLDKRQAALSERIITLPEGRNGWVGPGTVESSWHPLFVGSREQKGLYKKGDKQVEVYLEYYARQKQGTELVGWQNKVYDKSIAKRLEGGEDMAELPGKKPWPVRYMQIRSAEGTRLIWYWYEINGKPTINRLSAKLYEIQRRLIASDKGSAALLLSAPYELTEQEAKNTISSFLRDMLPSLRAVVYQ